jgi:phage tail-like protein
MIEVETTTGPEELWGELTEEGEAAPVEELGPATVAHVVDFYNRYPGEVVKFYTRVEVREPLSDLTLRISLPEGLVLDDYRAPPELDGLMPLTEVDPGVNYLVWSLEEELPAGTRHEFQAAARLTPTSWDGNLPSRAEVSSREHGMLAAETVSIAVWTKGRYLRYLPSLYERDELLGRFLMLFESFWAPIERQIDDIYDYFDPRMAPADFLPWLAGWLDLELDERWPEERLRRMLRWAIALHRSRGTKWGLLKYLEIYTGHQAEITERRARNFLVGPEARLGPAIALGRANVPHTFTVSLQLPPLEIEEKEERARQEQIRRHTIESIIEMQKPAHTVYTLDLEIVSPEELEARAAAEAEARAAAGAEEVDEIAAQAAIWFKLDDEPPTQKPKVAPKKRKSSKRKRGKKS